MGSVYSPNMDAMPPSPALNASEYEKMAFLAQGHEYLKRQVKQLKERHISSEGELNDKTTMLADAMKSFEESWVDQKKSNKNDLGSLRKDLRALRGEFDDQVAKILKRLGQRADDLCTSGLREEIYTFQEPPLSPSHISPNILGLTPRVPNGPPARSNNSNGIARTGSAKHTKQHRGGGHGDDNPDSPLMRFCEREIINQRTQQQKSRTAVNMPSTRRQLR